MAAAPLDSFDAALAGLTAPASPAADGSGKLPVGSDDVERLGAGENDGDEGAAPQLKPPRPGGGRLGFIRRSPYFRRGAQCGLGTTFIVAVCSVPAVDRALSVGGAPASSTTPGPAAFVLLSFLFTLLVSSTSGMSPLHVVGQQITGTLVGGAAAVAVVFATWAVNGRSYVDSAAKGAFMVAASAAVLFVATVARFHQRRAALLHLFLSITFAVSTTSNYHTTATDFYSFVLLWYAYSAIGATVAFTCATFILPISAGDIVRRRVAAGLLHTADVTARVAQLMSGEVADTGLLAAASGETSERIGLDSGLYPQLAPLFERVMAASLAFRDAYSHLPFAPHWFELYRAQHRFRRRAFWLTTLMGRSYLSSIMMLVYPVQTGTLHVALIAKRRAQLLRVAEAMGVAAAALGDVLVQNAPVGQALGALRELEGRYASLAGASRARAGLTQDSVALDMVLSLLYTAITRLRRMAMLLPEALGADQPDSLAPVLAHFAPVAAGGACDWSFASMTMPPDAGTAGEVDPLEQLRASLAAAQRPVAAHSAAAAALMAAPPLVTLPAAARPARAWRAALRWLPDRLGIAPTAFILAMQLVVAYTTVATMMVIPAVDAAFNWSLSWSLFVVVSIIEPSTGAAIFKGLQRLAGTVAAGCVGVAAQYWVYLLNGLSYQMRPLKVALMAGTLGVLAFGCAAATVRFPRHSYGFTIAAVMLGLTALPGLQGDAPQPRVALWRAVTTALGVLVEVAAVTCIAPVTAKSAFTNLMAATLTQISGVACRAFEGALPRPLRDGSLSRAASEGKPEVSRRRWWHHWRTLAAGEDDPPAPAELLPATDQPLRQLARAGGAEEASDEARRRSLQQPTSPSRDRSGRGLGSPAAAAEEHHAVAVEITLRPVITRPHEWQQQGQPAPDRAPASPMGSPGSAPGSVTLRRRHGGSGVTADSAGAGASPSAALARSLSLSSDVSAHLSIYMGRQRTLKVMGSSYAAQLPGLVAAADSIVALYQLRTALGYELYPFSVAHRFAFEPGFRAQRLCRHLLNIVASVPILLDSHDVAALPMLAPYAPRLHLLVQQLGACLGALAALVRGEHPPASVVPLVLSLEEHVQRLVLLVLTQLARRGCAAVDAETMTGLAYLGVLCNASLVVRLLCIALIRTYYPGGGSGASAAEAALLDHAQRWSLDDRVLQLFTGILGVAIGSSASGSGGPMTPRLATPRHGGGFTPRASGRTSWEGSLRAGSAVAAVTAAAAGI